MNSSLSNVLQVKSYFQYYQIMLILNLRNYSRSLHCGLIIFVPDPQATQVLTMPLDKLSRQTK